nr:glutaredoxin family protein [Calidifontibacillus oryziterrae]
MQVNFYTRTVCPLCDHAKEILEELKNEYPIEIKEIDIYEDDELLEKYQLMIPVVEIEGVQVDYGTILKDIVREYLQNLHINDET